MWTIRSGQGDTVTSTVSRNRHSSELTKIVAECYICNETGHYGNSCPWRTLADGTERRAVELRGKRKDGVYGLY
jgi:hypothetical protein